MSVTLDLNKQSGILNLTKEVPGLKKIVGVLNWNENPLHKNSLTQGFDLDIFAFVLGADQKLVSADCVVFFNNKHLNGGGVSVPVDNRTGAGDDDEKIFIEHAKLLNPKKYIDVYVFIHEAVERGQTFGMMTNASFTMTDEETGKEIVKYNISTYTNETVIHIGRFEVLDNGSGLKFEPSGDARQADPNQVAAAYA